MLHTQWVDEEEGYIHKIKCKIISKTQNNTSEKNQIKITKPKDLKTLLIFSLFNR